MSVDPWVVVEGCCVVSGFEYLDMTLLTLNSVGSSGVTGCSEEVSLS